MFKNFSLYTIILNENKQFEFKYIGDINKSIDQIEEEIHQSISNEFNKIRHNSPNSNEGVMVMPFIYVNNNDN